MYVTSNSAFTLFITGILLILTTSICGAADTPRIDLEAEVAASTHQLDICRAHLDLPGFKAAVNKTAAEWMQTSKEGYYRSMADTCALLRMTNFVGDEHLVLAEKYAMQALQENDQLPFGVEIKFVESLRPNGSDSQIKMRWWLMVWQQMEQSIDPTFGTPGNNPHVSIGSLMMPNRTPEQQARLNQILEQNRKNLEYVNFQTTLRRTLPSFSKIAVIFFRAVCRRQPENLNSLQAMVNDSKLEPATKQFILTQVQTKQYTLKAAYEF